MIRPFQIVLLFFITASAAGQSATESHETQIKNLIIDSFQDIFSNLDQATVEKYYTADFLLLEDGEVWDMEMIANYMDRAARQQNRPERINSFEFIEIQIAGKMAWTAYRNNARFEKDGELVGEMNWLESATAILTEDGWKLQMLHSTVVDNEH